MAEKAAWKFAEENDLDIVVVNPGTVMGPIIPPAINASMQMLLRLLQGNPIFDIHLCALFKLGLVACHMYNNYLTGLYVLEYGVLFSPNLVVWPKGVRELVRELWSNENSN